MQYTQRSVIPTDRMYNGSTEMTQSQFRTMSNFNEDNSAYRIRTLENSERRIYSRGVPGSISPNRSKPGEIPMGKPSANSPVKAPEEIREVEQE